MHPSKKKLPLVLHLVHLLSPWRRFAALVPDQENND
jgi:hypothetical protein